MRLEWAPGKERRVQGPALAENKNDSKISSFKLHFSFPQTQEGEFRKRLVSPTLPFYCSPFDMITNPICQSPETRFSLDMMYQ
jgi:hypothetical protein